MFFLLGLPLAANKGGSGCAVCVCVQASQNIWDTHSFPPIFLQDLSMELHHSGCVTPSVGGIFSTVTLNSSRPQEQTLVNAETYQSVPLGITRTSVPHLNVTITCKNQYDKLLMEFPDTTTPVFTQASIKHKVENYIRRTKAV